MQAWSKLKGTHNPADSCSLIDCLSRMAWIVGCPQRRFMSSRRAWSITPGSSGSSQSTRWSESKLSLPARVNAAFHATVEFTAGSFCLREVVNGRSVASRSIDPGRESRLMRTSSTCNSGRRRIFMLSNSASGRGDSWDDMLERALGGRSVVFWARVIASMITCIDLTTLS
jgi:hypothetical protein